MKGLALLLIGPIFVAIADEQFQGNPLHVSGDFTSKGNQTTYSINLRNVTNKPITSIELRRVGLWIHNRSFNPPLIINAIPAKGNRQITVSVRGSISGLVEPCLIGIEGTALQGSQKSYFWLRHPRSQSNS